MREILLTNTEVTALVDDEDFLAVASFSWHARRARNTNYAVRRIPGPRRSNKKQTMHVFLMGTPLHLDTHHKNGNGLDNRRSENLEILTKQEHRRLEIHSLPKGKSGYVGVRLQSGRWEAHLWDSNKSIYIGRYATAEEAAKARDTKARELGWPEKGMNFPA